MHRRLLVRLRARLEVSPLPQTDPVRLELEAELIDLMTPPRGSHVRLRIVREPASVSMQAPAPSEVDR